MSKQQNHKSVGEKGVLCVLSHLAKYDIQISLPFSDNLPYDLVADLNGKLFKLQVKSSNYSPSPGSVEFSICSNNWYKKTITKYNDTLCDIMVCYDIQNDNVYLLSPEEFSNRKAFTIRKLDSINKQSKRCHFHADFILSEKRIQEVFV